MATNASPDTSAHPTKDEPTCPERDARESAHNDSSTVGQNNPPNHGIPTHSAARFLWEIDSDTPVEELGRLYERWRDDSKQADLSGWSE